MCEICRSVPCDPRCPNYETPLSKKTGLICDMCGEEILVGEEYLDDGNGYIAHSDCISGISNLVDWLDLELDEVMDYLNISCKTADVDYDYRED